MKEIIVLNLPKDLGDGLLSLPAIQRLKAYAAEQGADLVATGSARSREWVETMGGLKLEFKDGDALKLLAPRFVMNLNFYDTDSIGKIFPDTPIYAPEKLRVLENDEKDFGAGAVLGKKHISLLLEDALKSAGVMGVNEKLPVPQFPASFTEDKFIDATKQKFGVSGKYALLIPVAAASRPLKKWPKENYAEVAEHLLAKGITPVFIGGPSPEEKALCAEINGLIGGKGIDLCGQTSLSEIAALAKGAELTLGNDTGPTHIAAVSGGKTFAFFGYYSDPATWQPITPNNTALVITGKPVPQITVEETLSLVDKALAAPKPGLAPKPAP